jgi:anti-anti-sigma factor
LTLEFFMSVDRRTLGDLEDRYAETLDIDSSGDTQTWRLAVAGEVDAITGAQLHDAVMDVLCDPCPRHIAMDLHDVTFLDSSGIRTLLQCHTDAEQAHCHLQITDASAMVYGVLEVTGLLAYFHLTTALNQD